MKQLSILIIMIMLLSCKTKQDIKISEVSSNSYVTLSEDFKVSNSDSICLNIPLELEINFPDNTKKVVFELFINGKYKQYINDYKIEYTKKNKPQILYEGITFNEERPEKLIIRLFIKNNLISKKTADSLLIKYDIQNLKANDIHRMDSVKLGSYVNFRKQNFKIMKFIRKKEDFLIINTKEQDKKDYSSTKYKINW